MRALSGLNLFLAVPSRGQSPFIENAAASHWETEAPRPIMHMQVITDLLQNVLLMKQSY